MSLTNNLSKLSNKTIQELLEFNQVSFEKEASKESLLLELKKISIQKGLESVLNYLSKEEMKKSIEAVGEKPAENKTKMFKDLKSYLKEKGVEEYIQKLEDGQKKHILERGTKKNFENEQNLKDVFLQQVENDGLEKMLVNMQRKYLVEVSKELGLSEEGTKDQLIKKIFGFEEKKKEKIKEKKERGPLPEIKKGITYDEIFQAYFLEELKEYCKKEGLKLSGNRKEVIKRILAHLDGESAKPKRKRSENTESQKKKKEEKTEEK